MMMMMMMMMMLRLEPSVPPGSAASFPYPQEFLQQGVFPEFAKFKAGIVNNVKKLSKYHLLGITRKHVLSFFHKKGK